MCLRNTCYLLQANSFEVTKIPLQYLCRIYNRSIAIECFKLLQNSYAYPLSLFGVFHSFDKSSDLFRWRCQQYCKTRLLWLILNTKRGSCHILQFQDSLTQLLSKRAVKTTSLAVNERERTIYFPLICLKQTYIEVDAPLITKGRCKVLF